MKKYVKPELFFESYELSQNIAACGWDMQNATQPSDCKALGDPSLGNPDILVFTEAAKCDNILERYCYENSASNETIKIFMS